MFGPRGAQGPRRERKAARLLRPGRGRAEVDTGKAPFLCRSEAAPIQSMDHRWSSDRPATPPPPPPALGFL